MVWQAIFCSGAGAVPEPAPKSAIKYCASLNIHRLLQRYNTSASPLFFVFLHYL